MQHIITFSAFGQYLLYLMSTVALWVVGLTIYINVTPVKELSLIKAGNTTASLTLGGVALGMAMPLAVLSMKAASVSQLAIWACIALAIQLVAYAVVTRVLHIRRSSEEDNKAVGILCFALYTAVGLIQAATMSW